MNKEQTIEAIKVMQAWVDGASIRWRYKGGAGACQGGFTNITAARWNWWEMEYSVAPLKKKCRLALCKIPNTGSVYPSVAFENEIEQFPIASSFVKWLGPVTEYEV